MTELDNFAKLFEFPLDGYQLEACAEIEAGRGVLVAAPTGAGKTVVGEFAVHLALAEGRKCFYTTPIKALSNQKFHDLVDRYGEDQVGLLTGDTTINGEAPIVVMTTEVLRNMLYAVSSTLNGLGYVVMDEVHYLADRFRGAVWEEIIIGLAESVQLVSLSATVSNAEEFGDWLNEVRGNVSVVVSERRPVPLFQHVMAGKKIYDLFDGDEVNPALVQIAKTEARGVRDDSRRPRSKSGRGRRSTYGSGHLGGAAHHSHRERYRHLVPKRAAVVDSLEQLGLLPAIYFIFSRAGCDQAVGHVLNSGIRLTSRRERDEIDAILHARAQDLEPLDRAAIGFDAFADALRRGVAAHHAGLLPVVKECVEEAFVRGLCKVVFATETLALGINMPAKSVVLEKLVKYNGEAHVDITPGEFTQLTGRAGRRGIDVEGHAVVLWQSGLEPRAVAGLASKRTYPLRSSFVPTYNMAVNMIARVGRERARGLLEQSFAQFQSDASVVGLARQIAKNQLEIGDLWAQTDCDAGDFVEYARMREQLSVTEAEAARQRRSDRRAEASDVLRMLRVGDVLGVPAGKLRGWVVVVDPGLTGPDPKPLVCTPDRQMRRLSTMDFPVPPPVAGRIRVPRQFHPKDAAAKRALAAVLRGHIESQRLEDVPRARLGEVADDTAASIAVLRHELRKHPCHGCAHRDEHARFAEQAVRLERDTEALTKRSDRRTNTIAVRFDRICSVLEALGYLTPGGQEITASGFMLARIYSELDLVTAECVRAGLFEELSAPEFAAVISTLVYEGRGDDHTPHRMPNRSAEIAQSALRNVWREVRLLERDNRLHSTAEPNLGFAEAAFDWASGRSLAGVLGDTDLTAGDFVRWSRQVIDLAGQIAAASGPGRVQDLAHECMDRMRRGVVL